MHFGEKVSWQTASICLITALFYGSFWVEAYMKSARVEETPFSWSGSETQKITNAQIAAQIVESAPKGIYAVTKMERQRNFIHLFHVPYIVCFFAAKGKWPMIPAFMQARVDSAARTLFSHNDSFIKQFCQKWVAIKECFRPLFSTATTPAFDAVEKLSPVRSTACTCPTTETAVPVVFFDRDHIGSVSSETIQNTIEFLESFLPPPTKKTKRKNRVRGRLDEISVD